MLGRPLDDTLESWPDQHVPPPELADKSMDQLADQVIMQQMM